MTDLRISVKNTSQDGGTFLTPFYFGFHDGSFDLFDVGAAASPGLESLAEDGSFATIEAERRAADADSQGFVLTGADGPIATQEFTAGVIENVDGVSNGNLSFGAMILPSNDAFIGTDEAIELFSANGRFLGAQLVSFDGSRVYDAGTEVNTEEDAAFLNQMAPDTGVNENGVIALHPGFNGSAGNPMGDGDMNIIGGINAFGVEIAEAADFTLPGAQIATVHINTVETHVFDDMANTITAGRSDDLVEAGGGDDRIITRGGWDQIDAGDGADFVHAGAGADMVMGGLGRDTIRGSLGDDTVYGGRGRDEIKGGQGDDIVDGGIGRDRLHGGQGDDMFLFASGDGTDTIRDFDRSGDDKLYLMVDGIDSFEDVLDHASEVGNNLVLDFGSGDSIVLRGESLSTFMVDDVLLA